MFGWCVDCVCAAGSDVPASGVLYRHGLPVGDHYRPFLFGPESKSADRRFQLEIRAVGKRLYCGNLSYNVTSSDLEELFSQFGTVASADVISDRESGRSKGFGFVEMSTDDEAQAAIAGLDQQEHDGRRLNVNEARPREERGGGGGGRGGRGGYGGGRY